MSKGAKIILERSGDLCYQDAEAILGKEIIGVENGKFELKLRLDDGKILKVIGHDFEDSSLEVTLEEEKKETIENQRRRVRIPTYQYSPSARSNTLKIPNKERK